MNKSKIVDIPSKMEKYYGKGKMLHPSIEVVEDVLRYIPQGKISTIDLVCKKLATDFGTDVTCPMRTGNNLKKIALNYSDGTIDNNFPFWRVIRTDKMMIKFQNYEFWASKLEDEGFILSFSKSGNIKVDFQSDSLFDFRYVLS
jgi:alkylated DNA nucleotide flippase Atl1